MSPSRTHDLAIYHGPLVYYIIMYAGIVAMLVRASRAHFCSKVEHVGLNQWLCSFRECRVRIEPANIQGHGSFLSGGGPGWVSV